MKTTLRLSAPNRYNSVKIHLTSKASLHYHRKCGHDHRVRKKTNHEDLSSALVVNPQRYCPEGIGRVNIPTRPISEFEKETRRIGKHKNITHRGLRRHIILLTYKRE